MAKVKKAAPPEEADGVFVYIGPTLRGKIQNGSVFRGKESGVKEKATAFIVSGKEQVKALIVRDTELTEAREKIKISGNGLNAAYRAILSAQ